MQPSITKIPDVNSHPAPQQDLSEVDLASLVDAFAASVPEDYEHEYPDDPVIYIEAMASPHATQWHIALQEEFDSLKCTGTYTLVPHSDVPHGCHIMQGQPIFKLTVAQKSVPMFVAFHITASLGVRVWEYD